MPLQQRSEHGLLTEDPEESLVDAHLSGAEDGEETPSHSSSSSSSSSSTTTSSSPSSPSSLTSSCSFLFLMPLEEGSAAGSLSPPQSSPQSPQSCCPSPADMAGAPGSHSDEEGSSTCGDSAVAQAWLQDAHSVAVAELVLFLLLKYRSKQPTTQAEMLTAVSQDDQDQFPEIFRQACEHLLLVFGVDVKEVDPGEHSYIPLPVLGLSCDDTPSGRQGMPKTGLLVLVLGVILLEDNHAPEEEVWRELGVMGVYAGREHIFYGEPRELLTHVWVQEGYLEYRQVPGSEPARFEFLWGPRAHAETSGMQVLQHILMVHSRYLGASPCLGEEAGSHEQERARAGGSQAPCHLGSSSFPCGPGGQAASALSWEQGGPWAL